MLCTPENQKRSNHNKKYSGAFKYKTPSPYTGRHAD